MRRSKAKWLGYLARTRSFETVAQSGQLYRRLKKIWTTSNEEAKSTFVLRLMDSVIGTHSHLKLGEEWTQVSIISEPYVVLSFRGFCPVVDVRLSSGETRALYIGSKSLSNVLAPVLLGPRGNVFTGLSFEIRKAGKSYMSPLEVRNLRRPMNDAEKAAEASVGA